MSEINKYCAGLDCAFCDEKEPCIYKIANELRNKLQEIKNMCKEIIDNDVCFDCSHYITKSNCWDCEYEHHRYELDVNNTRSNLAKDILKISEKVEE